MTAALSRVYEFGPFRLDATRHLLFRDDEPIALTPKALETLLFLVEHRGQLVEKDVLMRELWPDTFVEEGGLTRNISVLRKAFGEGPADHQYIETVPKRGYRFVASVREVASDTAETGPSIQDAAEQDVAQSLDVGKAPFRRRHPRRLVLVASLLLVGLVILLAYVRTGGPTTSGNALGMDVRSIAILPFRPIGANTSDEYLGPGLADAVITKLSAIRQITVRPTGSVLEYIGPGGDPLIVGRKLEVDAVLDGSVQQRGERIRLTLRLMRVKEGTPLWAETFDEPWTDIFAVQDSIAERVAQALTLQLSGEEGKALAKRPTENTAAYREYLMGRHLANQRTAAGVKKGLAYFEQAIALDPAYALAYAGLADAYTLASTYRIVPSREAYPKARHAAGKAIELDATLAEAHTVLALVSIYYDWDWPQADRSFNQSLALKPDDARGRQLYSQALMWVGRFDEALREIRRAQQLDPLSPIINANVGQTLYNARRYEEAIQAFEKALEISPTFFQARRLLGQAYVEKGMYREAIAEYTRALELGGGAPVVAELARAYGLSGQRDEAMKQLKELKGLSARQYVAPFDMAVAYAGLGERDQAFAWLEKSYEERERSIVTLNVSPLVDSLRSDPRFADLLRRVGFSHQSSAGSPLLQHPASKR